MDFGYLQLYIDGQLVDASDNDRFSVVSPVNERSIASIAWAGKLDAIKALESAHRGFSYWSKLSLVERTVWMKKLREAILKKADLLRLSITYEMGKTYEGSKEDIVSLTDALEWYPSAMKHLKDEIISDYENTHTHKMIHQPAGVAVTYLAWNFPLLNAGFKIGPALAAGCSLILKPSERSPVSAYLLGQILHEIEFPAGVINILTGPPEEVATALSTSTIPRVITMIGSTKTGMQVIADSATSIKRLGMELGGNAPFIVFDDADLEAALDLAVGIKFGNCGQICVAANRFFIHENIYDEFLKKYVNRVSKLKLGHGKDSGADMGPLISQASRQRILSLIQDAVSKGAQLEIGGKIPEEFDKGFWFEPTVLSRVTPEMLVYKEEIFGPVAGIMKFDDEDEVIRLANDTEHGLASYLFTNDQRRINKFSKELDFGEIQVNGVKYAIYLPHGGIKNSGIGHDCSHLALNDYLVKKRITISN